jgi:transglutaminase-like putative cysteine protease
MLDGGQMEIVVKGMNRPRELQAQVFQEPPAEYLRSNHYLKSDDTRVRELAKRAVGDATDPWKKAMAIENWVDANIRNKNNSEAFATADEVARHLQGDCTEHAVLAAAMCRAVGVPARTAVGLVYVPNERAMGYHMWIEVWIAGQWYGLDPTLGRGHVDACHLKITDQHWNDTQGLLPFLPVTRVLGKVQLEVVSIKYDDSAKK